MYRDLYSGFLVQCFHCSAYVPLSSRYCSRHGGLRENTQFSGSTSPSNFLNMNFNEEEVSKINLDSTGLPCSEIYLGHLRRFATYHDLVAGVVPTQKGNFCFCFQGMPDTPSHAVRSVFLSDLPDSIVEPIIVQGILIAAVGSQIFGIDLRADRLVPILLYEDQSGRRFLSTLYHSNNQLLGVLVGDNGITVVSIDIPRDDKGVINLHENSWQGSKAESMTYIPDPVNENLLDCTRVFFSESVILVLLKKCVVVGCFPNSVVKADVIEWRAHQPPERLGAFRFDNFRPSIYAQYIPLLRDNIDGECYFDREANLVLVGQDKEGNPFTICMLHKRNGEVSWSSMSDASSDVYTSRTHLFKTMAQNSNTIVSKINEFGVPMGGPLGIEVKNSNVTAVVSLDQFAYGWVLLSVRNGEAVKLMLYDQQKTPKGTCTLGMGSLISPPLPVREHVFCCWLSEQSIKSTWIPLIRG